LGTSIDAARERVAGVSPPRRGTIEDRIDAALGRLLARVPVDE